MFNLHEFTTLITELIQENIPILVEGINDKKALEHFNLTNIIMVAKHPLYKIIEHLERIDATQVCILTDLDSAGKSWYKKLNHECSQRGIRINNKLRLYLMKKTSLHQIENLPAFVRNQDTQRMF